MKYKQHTTTSFELKWGVMAADLAKSENTTIDAIHMRVYNFGSPFQRKSKPTPFEVFFKKTQLELAQECDVHISTIAQRVRKTGSPYSKDLPRSYEGRHGLTKGFDHFNDLKATITAPYQKSGEWLHPDHPEYRTWRSKWLPILLAKTPWCDLDVKYIPLQEDEQ